MNVWAFGLIAVAILTGATIGRMIFSGGWAKREVHSCGWHEMFDFNTHYKYGGPCPGCGVDNREWTLLVGAPIPFLPFGWLWKDKTPSDVRKESCGGRQFP